MRTAAGVEPNRARIARGIGEAAARGADLLAVPECALSGYLPRRDLDFAALADAEAELCERAAQAGIYLAFGTARPAEAGWRNAALLCSPDGRIVARYDKTHLTDADERVFAPGDELPVRQLGDWTVALQICFDMRFPENWRILRRKGAELVIHLSNASRSSAWKVPVLEGAVRSRAAENGMFVVSANDARVPQMMVSAIVDPQGRDLARAPEGEEALIVAELDRSAVRDDYLSARRTDLWRQPPHRDLLLE